MRCVKTTYDASVDFLISLGIFKYKRIYGSEMKMSCINGETCGAQKLNCCSNLHGCSTRRSALRLISFSEQNK